jgi:hypothetical protein
MARELGLEYDNIPLDPRAGDTRKADYLKINPNGQLTASMVTFISVFTTRRDLPLRQHLGGSAKGPSIGHRAADNFRDPACLYLGW